MIGWLWIMMVACIGHCSTEANSVADHPATPWVGNKEFSIPKIIRIERLWLKPSAIFYHPSAKCLAITVVAEGQKRRLQVTCAALGNMSHTLTQQRLGRVDGRTNSCKDLSQN